jgi:hypothetical protein
VKDQFTLSDRKFRPATGAREFPILGMARPNAFGWSVVDDQRTARDYRAARSCRKYRIGRFGWWQHAHVQFSCAFRMAASQELTVRRLVVESLTCPWQSMFPICPRKRSGHSKVAQSTVSEKGGHRAPTSDIVGSAAWLDCSKLLTCAKMANKIPVISRSCSDLFKAVQHTN